MTDKTPQPINSEALKKLFIEARTHNGWSSDTISDQTLHDLYDLLKWGPTSANSSPGRFCFIKSAEAKQRLKPCLMPGNVEKTMAAPVTVIIAQDLAFYEHLHKLFPHTDAKSWFVGNQELIEETAFRNATLQGAYLIMAARALGLDCGPMSGFDKEKADQEFFMGTTLRSNFLCNLGYGLHEKLFRRNPRLSFGEACQIL